MWIPAAMGPVISLDTSTTECGALQWLGIDMQPLDALIIPSNLLSVPGLVSPSTCEGVIMRRRKSNNSIGRLFFLFEHYLRKGITDESRLFHGMPRL